MTRAQVIDRVVDASPPCWYTVISAGQVLPPSFIKDIDRAINEKLDRFVLVRPNAEGVGFLLMTDTHRRLAGNRKETIEYEGGETLELTDITQKVEFWARENDTPNMIREVASLCPALS